MEVKVIGQAVFAAGELRCSAPRKDNPDKSCHKLICFANRNGLVAGKFQCDRCANKIEVVLERDDDLETKSR